MKKTLGVLALIFTFTFEVYSGCGVWRRDAKILADPQGHGLLSKTPIVSTVDDLAGEHAPRHLSIGSNFSGRIEGESDLVEVDAFIVEYKSESNDQDFHIVLRSKTSDKEIVSEIPDPTCPDIAQFPDLVDRYRALREWFVGHVGKPAVDQMKTLDTPIPVKVVGAAFWDAPHGATGASAEGREIHPITDFIVQGGSVFEHRTETTSTLAPPPTEPSPSPIPIGGTMNNVATFPVNEVLSMIVLGALLGMAGQVIRIVVGLKKAKEAAAAPGAPAFRFDNQQMLVSLMIALIVGGIAGVLASVNSLSNLASIDKATVFAFIAAGYAGTDLIEGFVLNK
jgi:hypothetical protein